MLELEPTIETVEPVAEPVEPSKVTIPPEPAAWNEGADPEPFEVNT